MKSKNQIMQFMTLNKDLFKEKFHVIKIGIFGSYARGDHNNQSDLDLIVEFEENTQDLYDLKIQLKEFIKSKLGLEVDICREKYIKPRIKKSILKEVIYVS